METHKVQIRDRQPAGGSNCRIASTFSDDWVSAATQIGPSVELRAADKGVGISAIVEPRLRDVVNMVWGSESTYSILAWI